MVFPIAKLGYLALKQLSKPIAVALKRRAKSSRVFREYVCMPVAQSYHWADMQLKMRFLGLKPTNIEKLNEAMAIELGTDMLGEMAIFTMAAAILYLESWRSSSKDQRKENQQNVQLDKLTESVQEMSITVAEQDAKIRELMHRLAELNAPNYKKVIQFVVTKDPDEKPSR